MLFKFKISEKFNYCSKKKKIKFSYNPCGHPFHIVDPSPWPFCLSVGVLTTVVAGVAYLHNDRYMDRWAFTKFVVFFVFCLIILGLWFRDIVTEATFEGQHTEAVQRGIKMGMVLFIVSEIMFFFSFFWAFFHASLVPSIHIGCVWPPKGIVTFNPWEIPLFNTVVLLSSGATVTVVHYGLLAGSRFHANWYFILTIFYGLLFTLSQGFEYKTASFDISDGIYGSVFYMLTGFHGFHVIIGTVFLIVCAYRQYKYHFTRTAHVGFECAAWYWHFVDIVWIFLYLFVYVWGG